MASSSPSSSASVVETLPSLSDSKNSKKIVLTDSANDAEVSVSFVCSTRFTDSTECFPSPPADLVSSDIGFICGHLILAVWTFGNDLNGGLLVFPMKNHSFHVDSSKGFFIPLSDLNHIDNSNISKESIKECQPTSLATIGDSLLFLLNGKRDKSIWALRVSETHENGFIGHGKFWVKIIRQFITLPNDSDTNILSTITGIQSFTQRMKQTEEKEEKATDVIPHPVSSYEYPCIVCCTAEGLMYVYRAGIVSASLGWVKTQSAPQSIRDVLCKEWKKTPDGHIQRDSKVAESMESTPSLKRLCVDNVHGHAYFTEFLKSKVIRYHLSNSNDSLMWGSRGNDHGQFKNPDGIECFPSRCSGRSFVCVAELQGNRIQMNTVDGKFLGVWGKEGEAEGIEFRGPSALKKIGIIKSPDDKDTNNETHVIAVLESVNKRIQIFTIQWCK